MSFKGIKESSVMLYYKVGTGLRKERLNPSQDLIEAVKNEADEAFMIILDAQSQEKLVMILIKGNWHEECNIIPKAS